MSTKTINSLLLEWNKPFGKGYREAQRKLCAQELQPIKEALEREIMFMNQLADTQETTGFPNSAKIARQCADAISLICGGCASAALHKEGAGGECAYKKQHNIGFPCPHCGVIEPLPLQRTLPDEQFKGVVVERIEGDAPPVVCSVCDAMLEIADGEHVCGLTASEAYSLGWRRGNNAPSERDAVRREALEDAVARLAEATLWREAIFTGTSADLMMWIKKRWAELTEVASPAGRAEPK